ncbi:hypothetical protein B0E48_13145 [Rhodanobacter sp. C03]|nr:hypothetical protein B0E48_13145 [Rhodanobacter sp. C03]
MVDKLWKYFYSSTYQFAHLWVDRGRGRPEDSDFELERMVFCDESSKRRHCIKPWSLRIELFQVGYEFLSRYGQQIAGKTHAGRNHEYQGE